MKKLEMWRKPFVIVIVWLLFGFVTVVSLSTMWVNGSFNLERFYDVGEVYEVTSPYLEGIGTGFAYQEAEDVYLTITEENANKLFVFNKGDWRYLVIELDNLNKEEIECQIEGYTQNADELIYVKDIFCVLEDGINVVQWDMEELSVIRIYINNQAGTTLRMKNMLFMQRYIEGARASFWKAMGVIGAVYLLISWMFWQFIGRKKLIGRNWAIIDKYQNLLCEIANNTPRIFNRLPIRRRHIVRVICFVIWIHYFVFVIDTARRGVWDTWHYFVSAAIMLIIGLISMEGELKKLNWNNPLVKSWLIYWIMACGSDLLIEKRWNNVGYLFLVIGGFVFLIWGNMKRPEEILQDIVYAFHISFVISSVFCFVCRPQYEGYSYLGLNCNPNIFAFYLLMITAGCLTHLLAAWEKQQGFISNVLLGAELSLIAFFLWRTQCRSAILAFGFLSFIMAFQLFQKRFDIKYRKSVFAFCVSIVLLTGPIWLASDTLIKTLPYKLGTTVILEDDVYKPIEDTMGIFPISGSKVYASESKLLQKFKTKSLDSFMSGRLKIWKAYLRQMNLIGNRYKADVNGVKLYAHNALIVTAFRYGVYSIIPYIIMWGCILHYSWIRRKEPYQFLVFGLCSAYFIMALLDALEQPWRDPIWIMVYFIIGCLFQDKKKIEETERGKICEDTNG